MTRVINIDGEDFAGRIRDDGFEFSEAAYKGEVAFGGLDVDGVISTNVPPHKAVSVNDAASSPNDRVYTGFTASRALSRGPFKVGHDKRWDVDTVDLNTLFDDRVIRTADGSRGAETDVARVLWLLGSGYLPLDDEGVAATPTTSLPAYDFRGKYARDVLDAASELAGKNYFAFYHQSLGNSLWYDTATSSNFQSAYRLSSVLADATGQTFHARGWRRTLDPARVYSGIRVEYSAGGSNFGNVFVERGAIASNFRRREITVFDDSVSSDAQGSNFGNAMLAMAETEEDTLSCEVDLTLAQAGFIMPGHRVAVKSLGNAITAFTNYRVVRRTLTPRNGTGDFYTAALSLALPKSTRFSGRGSPDLSGGGSAVGDAELADGATGTPTLGIKIEPSTSSVLVVHIGSWVSRNIAWPIAGCAVGCGGWVDAQTQEAWYQFTAPSDSTSVGLSFEWTEGLVTGVARGLPLLVGVAQVASASAAFGEWTPFSSIANRTQEIFVPRSVLKWGAVNCIVIAPSWEACRNCFFCAEDLVDGCSGPRVGGEGYSGGLQLIGNMDYAARGFAGGTSGYAPWVSGIGAVDSSNRLFTLIGWNGTGKPEARIGVVDLGPTDLVYDTSAKTVTLPTAPRAGTSVTFRYIVS